MNEAVEVRFSALADLAIDYWRLQRWAFVSGYEKDRALARQACRTLNSFLVGHGIEIHDLAGQPYDPGLAVDVVDAEDAGATTGSAMIEETITPIVLWRGRVVRAGQVVVRYVKSDQGVRT